MPAALGELRRVVQQVEDDLREAGGIRVYADRLGVDVYFERMSRGFDVRPRRFHGVEQDRRQLDRLLAQLDLASRDAGDIEKVVHQPRHVPPLPVDDLPSRAQAYVIGREALDDIYR